MHETQEMATREVIYKTKGCFISPFDKSEIAKNINLAMIFNDTNGRNDMERLSVDKIAQSIIKVYNSVKKVN